jgi:DNA-directed RNA polymerase specialized sigma24 family protein
LLVSALKDEKQRQAVILRLQGFSLAEIAEMPEIGLSQRTLFRLMKKVKAWLERRLAEQGKAG